MLFSTERWADCVQDMRPLWKIHWEEVGDYSDKIPVEAREEEYQKLDSAGVLQVVTARDGDGKLHGYVWHVLLNHFHHNNLLCGMLDVWFVRPEKRIGGTGVKMFKFAEDELIRKGIKKFHGGHTVKLPLENVFDGLGYKLTELHYTKMV